MRKRCLRRTPLKRETSILEKPHEVDSTNNWWNEVLTSDIFVVSTSIMVSLIITILTVSGWHYFHQKEPLFPSGSEIQQERILFSGEIVLVLPPTGKGSTSDLPQTLLEPMKMAKKASRPAPKKAASPKKPAPKGKTTTPDKKAVIRSMAEAVQNAETSDFENSACPDGIYSAVAGEAVAGVTSSGNPYLALAMTVDEGEYAGEKPRIFQQIGYFDKEGNPDDEEKVGKSMQRLASLLLKLGFDEADVAAVPTDPDDTEATAEALKEFADQINADEARYEIKVKNKGDYQNTYVQSQIE